MLFIKDTILFFKFYLGIMTTLSKTYSQKHTVIKLHSFKWKYNELIKQLEFSYFAFISFSIAVSAILGGIVVMFSLEYHVAFWEFIFGMVLSLSNLVMALAQFPVKWVFNVFVATAFINICLIIHAVL